MRWICNFCDEKFITRNLLSIHKKDNKHYCCKFCKKQYDCYYQVTGHQNWCENNSTKKDIIKKISIAAKKRRSTQETKDKISKSRIKYLIANPDKVPYLLNHSSKKSYPEITFENALLKANITGWIYNYQNSIYQYDFAFPELKIDVEIDGATHLTEKVMKIDERRDKFSESQGWKVIRFTAKEVRNNVNECIDRLKIFMAPFA